MRSSRNVRAADQSMLPAQQVTDAVKQAWLAQPGAMPVTSVQLAPQLELTVVHNPGSKYYRVPVAINADGTFTFGALQPATGPISPNAYPSPPGSVNPGQPGASPGLPAPSGLTAGRGIPARDQQRIQAAIDRGSIPPERGQFYAAQAAAGEDISALDQLAGGVVLPEAGAVAAAAVPRDADAEDPEYHALFGRREPAEDGPEYRRLYGPVAEGQRVADVQAAATRDAVSALTDYQVYEQTFVKATAAAAPVTASAAGRADQHGREGASPRRYRVHAPNVTLRVPQGPADPALARSQPGPPGASSSCAAGTGCPRMRTRTTSRACSTRRTGSDR